MKKYISGFLAVLLVLGLLGCGKKKGEYVPTGDGLSPTGDTMTPEQQEVDLTQSLSLTYYPDRSLNPMQATDLTNRALLSLLYQGLFTVDREYGVQPVLCGKYRMSQDMKTYTFYPDSRATFSDGSRVRAEDISASLQAAMVSPYYKGRFQHVLSIGVTEDGGVAVNLTTPMENLPLLLDIPVLKGDQLEQPRPLGTGPYLWDANGRELCLRRRSDWWCGSDLKVTASTITLREAESPTQIRDNFQFDGLSLVCTDPSSDRYTDYRSDFELWDMESGVFAYLAFNETGTIFDDPALRSAVTSALDREKLAADNYRGFGRPVTLPASAASPCYDENLAARYEYDPDRFKQAVADAALSPDHQVLLLVNSDDSLRVRTARSIADMLREGGLNVTVRELATSDYTASVRARNFDIYLGQTRLSPNMDLSPFFHTNGALSLGGVDDVAAYALCLQALENYGNFYTLHQTVMDEGLLCPVLTCSYAVYGTRGQLTALSPSRDNIFYYSIGKTMEGAYQRQ